MAGCQPRCRTAFWCKVKDSSWDFPQNSGPMGTISADLLLPLPPNLSISAGPPVYRLLHGALPALR